jgi:AAHS family 4-hydroxybenzoate transporter-like MFS transporter
MAALVALAVLLDGLDNLLLGTIIPSLMQEWQLERGAFVAVVAFSIIGMSAGTGLLGVLGDRLGRRPVLIFCVVLFGAATLGCASSPSLAGFTAWRIASSIGLGGLFPNAVALVFEVTPTRHRNAAVSINQMCVPGGGMIGALLAAAMLPHPGWRSLCALGGGLALAVAVLLWAALAESPRALQPQSAKAGFADLLRAPLRRDSLALWAILFCNYLCIYGMFNWGPALITASGFAIPVMALSLSGFNLGSILGALCGGWLMDRFGSRKPTLYSAALAGVLAGCLSLGGWPWAGAALLIGGMFLLGLLICGLQAMLYALASAVYPASLRASGIGAATGVGRLGAIASALFGAGVFSLHLPGFIGLLALALFCVTLSLTLLERHSPPAA